MTQAHDRSLPRSPLAPDLTGQAGVTLIELMFGLLIGVVVVGAAFSILTMTSKGLRANEQIVDTQQNVRLAMELLARDLKMAGFGNPGVAVGNCTSSIVPSDNTNTGTDSGADSVQVLVPTTRTTGANRWTLSAPTTSGGITSITLQPGAVTDMVNSGLAQNSYISIGGATTVQVTAQPDQTNSKLTVSIPPPLWFQQEDQVYLLQCIRYRIVPFPDATGLCGDPLLQGAGSPCLTRGVAGVTTGPNAEAPIAEGIEDLQLSYACDGCTAFNSGIPDHIIDDVNTPAGFGQEDFLSNVPWTTAPLTPDKIKLIQIALVARQSKNDQGFGEKSQALIGSAAMAVGPAPSDHTLPADPNHRRRVLVKTVETRNVGL
jgi:type IV pilus assembly protein PilW